MNRQRQKELTYALAYAANPYSQIFAKAYVEEFRSLMASVAVSRGLVIGYHCLEHSDFTDIENRILQYHDEVQVNLEAPYTYTPNQRGRHWDKKRRESVKAKPKSPQELLDEDFKNDHTLYDRIHKMAKIAKPEYHKSIACKVVEVGGKLKPVIYWHKNFF